MSAAEEMGRIMGQTDRVPPPAEVVTAKLAHSATIGAIAGAMAKAQGEMRDAAKDSVNPHFKSKYADLASVWEACRAPLAKNEIAVFQGVARDDAGLVVVSTLLAHKSGEWLSSELSLRPVKDDPQSVGSAITYARRYALAAMTGVAPAEDDAEAAHGRDEHRSEPRPQQYQRAPEPTRAAPAPADARTVFVIPGGKSKGVPVAKASMEALDYWENRIGGEIEAGTAQHPDRDKLLLGALREEITKREAGTAALGSSIAALPRPAPADEMPGRR